MTLVPLTDCCRMLGIDAKTLRKWLQHAHLKLSAHPTDARLKCLTIEQVQQLATLYGRPPLASASAPPALLERASSRLAQEAQTPSLVPAPILPEADLIEKLACLERSVTTIQEQLAQLALEFLQERRLSSARRLSALETHLPPKLDTPVCLHEREALVEAHPPQGSSTHERGPHPAELRARSHLLPLIEYGAAGTYVVICPQEGELALTPDSPEWFAWLASLSSFPFVGKSGRFSARRGYNRRPNRGWYAQRVIHQHNYSKYIGVSEKVTTARLEQIAAEFQSYTALR